MKNQILKSITSCLVFSSMLLMFSCEKEYKAKEGVLVDSVPNEKELITNFVDALTNKEARDAYKFVVLYKEHVSIDTLFEGSVKDERSVKLMAKMVYDDNVKHLSRWEDLFKEGSLEFLNFEKEKEVEQGGPYLIHTGYKLFFKNTKGDTLIYKPFNSIIEQKGGFKIWNVLDTHGTMTK